MSYFGTWKCPSCGSTWIGSIGWVYPKNTDELNKMLHNICGCDGKIDGAKTPELSMSICNFKCSKDRMIKTYDKDIKYLEEEINKSVNDGYDRHKLLSVIEYYVNTLTENEIDVPEKLYNWIDYLNGV